jgi:hypothetical protein
MDSQDQEYKLWKIAWPHLVDLDPAKGSEELRKAVVFIVSTNADVFWKWWMQPESIIFRGFVTRLGTNLSHRRRPRRLRVRKRTDKVDFQLVRSWISRCCLNHGECRNRDVSDNTAMPLYVIDCQLAELRVASPEMKYAALSYVWANQGSIELQDQV